MSNPNGFHVLSMGVILTVTFVYANSVVSLPYIQLVFNSFIFIKIVDDSKGISV